MQQTRRFGPRQCALSELSDEELLTEVQLRRERRKLKYSAGSAPATDGPTTQLSRSGDTKVVVAATAAAPTVDAGTSGPGQSLGTTGTVAPSGLATPRRSRAVRQWLANLELPESATFADVEAAFERLRQRYEPATQDSDEKRRATAELLMSSLRAAYDGLRMHLSEGTPARM